MICRVPWSSLLFDNQCKGLWKQKGLVEYMLSAPLTFHIQSGLRLVGLTFDFQLDHDPKHTSRLCNDCLTKKEWYSAASDDLASTITWPQPNWDVFGMSWSAEWSKSSQQVLSICGNSFKTVGKAFQVKLVERMPRVWNTVIKAKGG